MTMRKLINIIRSSYFQLFKKKEYSTIRGYRSKNYLILTAVFIVTIGSLSFSGAGLNFLSHKMEDPFINWIDIRKQGKFETFYKQLEDDANKSTYLYESVENSNFILEYVVNSSNKLYRVEGRTIDVNNRVLGKILDDENVIEKRDKQIFETDYGWIVTEDLMQRLGYGNVEEYPHCIQYSLEADTAIISALGINAVNNSYIKIPIPIIAVVKQLPDVLDFITTSYFVKQNETSNKPFNISRHANYFNSLCFITENGTNKTEIYNILQNHNLDFSYSIIEYDETIGGDLEKLHIHINDTITPQFVNNLALQICQINGVERHYEYNFNNESQLPSSDYISIQFYKLNNIREFQKWAKEKFDIRIDMAQIDSKDNFKIFHRLATVLSVVIIVISIGFVLIFMYFLIDSHFQRISKNLGTIMAFGFNNNQIILIYFIVFIQLIVRALSTSVIILLIIEKILIILDKVWTDNFPYFDLSNKMVWTSIIVIVFFSAIAIIYFNLNKLKATPGDLIYERN